MHEIRNRWKHLGVNKKFGFIFALLFLLIFLIAATVWFSLGYLRTLEENIRVSAEVEQQVLEMDHGQERARRLLANFFLQHYIIGLEKAHEQYAQPSIRQIAEVILLSKGLQQNLVRSDLDKLSSLDRVEINLYLASAKRFADTSIRAIELISRREAPEMGLEEQIQAIHMELKRELQGMHSYQRLNDQAVSLHKDYKLVRRRSLMQSAFNTYISLRAGLSQDMEFPEQKKKRIFKLLDSYHLLADELLEVDLALNRLRNDFSLQEETILSVSDDLIMAARAVVEQGYQRIDKTYRVAVIIIFSTVLLVILCLLNIVRLLNNTVTRRIQRLTITAGEFSRGNLYARIPDDSRDELGQLAGMFNSMAARVQDLVDNLESKVAWRTKELAASESRFRNLLSDLPKIAVHGYDHERTVIYWNRTSESLYGYSEEEALGKKMEELIIPESMQSTVIRDIENWYENYIPIPASERILCHKDGGEVVVFSAHVMLSDGQGERTMYCVDIDLSELQLARDLGERSESFYRQLFDHSSSGIAVYEAVDDGMDFVFTDFNRAGEEIEGISREALIGRRVTEAFPGCEEFGILEVFRQVYRTGEAMQHPVAMYKDNRIQGWRENRVYKLASGEVVAVYEDIIAQKQVEEEKEVIEESLQRAKKMEAIGLMAGGVAHDLNNILSGIIGYPELLLMQLPEDSELRAPIQAIQDSGERAAAVVADLLTVARGVASVKTPASLNVLIREYFESPECQRLQSLYPHILCHKELADDLPDIACSSVHIKKCIMNLVTNAAEAMGEKPGGITIRTERFVPDELWTQQHGLAPGDYVALTVTDMGTGIPKKCLERIFEPFFTKKEMGRSGTGLGLAVVWNTMEEHDGTVTVTSCENGTTFTLYFPATDEVAVEENHEKVTIKGHGERILVVDDEPQLREIATSMLELLEYTVVSVSSGEEAVAYLRENQVELVLLDMLMDPGINGRQTYEQMLELYPGQKAIIASGFSENSEVKTTLDLGAAAFVKKPYSLEELGLAVKDCLGG